MGDRANVHVKDAKVLLYTHWHGTELPTIVQAALARGKGRWNDEAYLARIVFSEMVRDELLDDTGFGIQADCLGLMDNEHKIIQLDSRELKVRFLNEDMNVTYQEWSMEDYVAADKTEIEDAYDGERDG